MILGVRNKSVLGKGKQSYSGDTCKVQNKTEQITKQTILKEVVACMVCKNDETTKQGIKEWVEYHVRDR